MIGDRLYRFATRLLREETCARVVAPAIADLQFETPRGRTACIRAYVGVWRALIAALIGEIVADCAATLRDVRIARGIGPVLLTMFLGGLIAAPRMWMSFSAARPWHHDIILLLLTMPGIVVALAPATALPITAWLARSTHPGSSRAGMLIGGTIVSAVVLGGTVLQATVGPLHRELFFTSHMSISAGEQHRPLWTVHSMFAGQLRARDQRNSRAWTPYREQVLQAERRESRNEPHALFAVLLVVVGFTLLGTASSSLGRWVVPWLGAGAFVALLALSYFFGQVLYVQAVRGRLALIWTPAALFFLASAWIAVRSCQRAEVAA